MKISHRKGSTRVVQEYKIERSPARDVTVIMSAIFKMCYEHFHRYLFSVVIVL